MLKHFILIVGALALFACSGNPSKSTDNDMQALALNQTYCFDYTNSDLWNTLGMNKTDNATTLSLTRTQDDALNAKLLSNNGDTLYEKTFATKARQDFLELRTNDLTVFEQKLLWVLGESKTALGLNHQNHLKIARSKRKISGLTGFPIFSADRFDFYQQDSADCPK